ncbi:MAG TPA: hypothetical protein DHW82_01065 [Spirochaetia bacterium]|nr:hypothetical protein [Spirochaetia bacterium]
MKKNDLLDDQQIIRFLKNNKSFLFQHYHLKKLGIFGSYAKQSFTELSDIDIIIEIEENTPNIYELKQELRQYLEQNLHKKIDLAREKYLKPRKKNKIIRETIYV